MTYKSISKLVNVPVCEGAVKKMLSWRCEQTGARLCVGTVDFPVTGNQQVNAIQTVIYI